MINHLVVQTINFLFSAHTRMLLAHDNKGLWND